ncbi:MAG TPA: sulfotransferase [Candidatus Methanoperedens sp.]|nr:sulfotransferase [Candidatus Methanoperedens sp.]
MIPYLYLLGQSHSGSTILAFLANAHPEIVSVGEVSRLGEILPDRWLRKADLCSCGRSFYACGFWNRALAGLAARGHGLGATDPFGYPPAERETAERRLLALVEAMLDVTGKRVFFDASKALDYVPVIARNPHFAVRFIDLHRNGRGVITSWLNRLAGQQPERVVRRWVTLERQREQVRAQLPPGSVLRVSYEEVAAAPQTALRPLFACAGVAPDIDVSAGYKSKVEHHIIGNQMRLNDQESVRLDKKWRATWTPELERAFEKSGAAEINRRNGYAD